MTQTLDSEGLTGRRPRGCLLRAGGGGRSATPRSRLPFVASRSLLNSSTRRSTRGSPRRSTRWTLRGLVAVAEEKPRPRRAPGKIHRAEPDRRAPRSRVNPSADSLVNPSANSLVNSLVNSSLDSRVRSSLASSARLPPSLGSSPPRLLSLPLPSPAGCARPRGAPLRWALAPARRC